MSETNKQTKEERVSLKERRQKSLGTILGTIVGENKSTLAIFCVIVAVLAVILIGMIVLHMPIVPVCVIVVIESALAVCLHDVPIWLHGLAVIAQIIVGAVCGAAVFMILCVVVYVIEIFALRFIR